MDIGSSFKNIMAPAASGIGMTPKGDMVSANLQDFSAEVDTKLGAGTGTKNKIINGDMVVDQRNNGATQSALSGAPNYLVDRWAYGASQVGKFNSQQNAGGITPPTGFINYLGLTVASAYTPLAGDSFWISQKIEGLNCRDLSWGTANAKPVTLQFQVYSSLIGTHSGSLMNGAGNRTFPFSYTIPVANTWTTITVTILGDTTGTWLTNNGIGMYVLFNLGSGSNNLGVAGAWVGVNNVGVTGSVSVVGTAGATFFITGVQLEKGNTATTFDTLQYGDVLRQCRRYSRPLVGYYVGQAFSATASGHTIGLDVPMRATPSLNTTTGFTVSVASGGTVATTPVIQNLNDNCLYIITGSGSSLVAGNATILASLSGAYLSSEL